MARTKLLTNIIQRKMMLPDEMSHSNQHQNFEISLYDFANHEILEKPPPPPPFPFFSSPLPSFPFFFSFPFFWFFFFFFFFFFLYKADNQRSTECWSPAEIAGVYSRLFE